MKEVMDQGKGNWTYGNMGAYFSLSLSENFF